MSGGSYLQANILCPYYVSDDGAKSVRCEGLIQDSITKQCFSRRDFRRHVEIYCSGQYWFCEQCIALDQKYEREEET